MRDDMSDFIQKYRNELGQYIKRLCPNCTATTDEDNEEWVMNNESMYQWAIGEGVDI